MYHGKITAICLMCVVQGLKIKTSNLKILAFSITKASGKLISLIHL